MIIYSCGSIFKPLSSNPVADFIRLKVRSICFYNENNNEIKYYCMQLFSLVPGCLDSHGWLNKSYDLYISPQELSHLWSLESPSQLSLF